MGISCRFSRLSRSGGFPERVRGGRIRGFTGQGGSGKRRRESFDPQRIMRLRYLSSM